MTDDAVVFALLPLRDLKSHERVVAKKVRALAAEIRHRGVFEDPIWVARGSGVILNGHHRAAALRRLGADRVPAWVIDYDADLVRLGRWDDGPPIAKDEVVRRGLAGDLYPPRTTRHSLVVPLPPRPTPIEELGVPPGKTAERTQRGRSSSGRSRGRSAADG